MAVLVGEWTMEVPQFPNLRARSTIEWIEDGAYLVVRVAVDAGEIPSGLWIIGSDDSRPVCTALYYDERGVRRVYQTTLTEGIWRIWRDAPEFNQRFIGELESDGRAIRGRWEMSADGTDWQLDFDLVYRKVG
jgi:hypothetical protein